MFGFRIRLIPVMTVANKRYSPPYRRAKQFVDQGPVNNPAMYAAKFNLGYDYVVHMLEAGTIHLFDLTRYFMGEVATLNAIGVNKYMRNKGQYPFDEEFVGFMGLVENFLQLIRHEEDPLVTGWDGYRAYELNLATLLSLRRQAPVSLPLDAAEADAERAEFVEY